MTKRYCSTIIVKKMSDMIKISEAARIGIHAMAMMAKENHRKLSNSEMARSLKVSEAHLSKVMQKLAKAGLARGVRGPSGGYSLALAPENIRLMEIYEALEGPFSYSDCLLSERICSGESCIMGDLLRAVNKRIEEYFNGTRLSDLGDELVDTKEGPCLAREK